LDSEYFDSSVFLAIFNAEAEATDVRALVRELRRDKGRICTSILTIQEVSVASYLFGGDQSDNYAKVDRLARIHGVTRDMALLAARIEAAMLVRAKRMSKHERQALSPRRKLDCFHIATAIELGCRTVYSLDPGMLKCKDLIDSRHSITFAKPSPKRGELFKDGKSIRIQ
jgi:predicted nucleic acid-binding protein